MATTQASQTFTALNAPILKMMEWNRDKLEEVVRKTHEEQLRFVNRRLERTGRTLQTVRECQGLSGLIAAEQQWMLDAARDYFESMERFGGLFRGLTERSIEQASETMSSATRDVSAAASADARKARDEKMRAAE